MTLPRISRDYRVPATRGRIIVVDGQRAQIKGSTQVQMWLIVQPLDDEGNAVGPTQQVHPTWHVDYLDGRGQR